MLRKRLPRAPISRILHRMGVTSSDSGERSDEGSGSIFRMTGALTITRAASTQREIDSIADPLTIDLSGVEKMDTVGAWLVHRAMRDRNAKVVGFGDLFEQLLAVGRGADHLGAAVAHRAVNEPRADGVHLLDRGQIDRQRIGD